MNSDAKRQVNPIIELAGAQWLVYDWGVLAEADGEKPTTIVLYRLNADEQRLVAEANVDWELWDEVYHAMKERRPRPARSPLDIQVPVRDDKDGDDQ